MDINESNEHVEQRVNVILVGMRTEILTYFDELRKTHPKLGTLDVANVDKQFARYKLALKLSSVEVEGVIKKKAIIAVAADAVSRGRAVPLLVDAARQIEQKIDKTGLEAISVQPLILAILAESFQFSKEVTLSIEAVEDNAPTSTSTNTPVPSPAPQQSQKNVVTVVTTKPKDYLTARRLLIGLGVVAPTGKITDATKLGEFLVANNMKPYKGNELLYSGSSGCLTFRDGVTVVVPFVAPLVIDKKLEEKNVPAITFFGAV